MTWARGEFAVSPPSFLKVQSVCRACPLRLFEFILHPSPFVDAVRSSGRPAFAPLGYTRARPPVSMGLVGVTICRSRFPCLSWSSRLVAPFAPAYRRSGRSTSRVPAGQANPRVGPSSDSLGVTSPVSSAFGPNFAPGLRTRPFPLDLSPPTLGALRPYGGGTRSNLGVFNV